MEQRIETRRTQVDLEKGRRQRPTFDLVLVLEAGAANGAKFDGQPRMSKVTSYGFLRKHELASPMMGPARFETVDADTGTHT